jgi:large subunit ribosomal protein L28
MAKVCEVTGKKPLVGHNVSHSNRHTKRRFEINLFTKRFWLEDEKRWITLDVSARGMRHIDKRGLAAVVKDLRAAGKKI